MLPRHFGGGVVLNMVIDKENQEIASILFENDAHSPAQGKAKQKKAADKSKPKKKKRYTEKARQIDLGERIESKSKSPQKEEPEETPPYQSPQQIENSRPKEQAQEEIRDLDKEEKSPKRKTPKREVYERPQEEVETVLEEPEGDDEDATQLLALINAKIKSTTKNQEYEIDKPVVKIGRAPAPKNDITIDNKNVSRKHAEFLIRGKTLYVKDLGSKNRTFIDGIELPAKKAVEVKNGQTVSFANADFVVLIPEGGR